MVFSSAQGEKKPLGLELEYVEKLAQIERLRDFFTRQCVLECIMHCFGYNLRMVRFV